MEIDSFFQIGKDHKICEDYASKGFLPYEHVIIADGCSSNENTDIGSRILVSITKKNLEKFNPLNYIEFLNIILKESRAIASLMGLNKNCLNATLLLLINYNNKIYALLIGDGCLIYKEKNQDVCYRLHEYTDNFPFYLNYLNLNVDKKDSLVIKNEANKITEKSFSEIVMYEFNKEDLEWIVISSDGISSFSNGSQLYETENIIKQISDFKSFKGEFIQRKMKRIIKNSNKETFYNFDDWSLGGIYIENGE